MPVVNRGGAGGAIGNASVARAAPDGHTLLMALSSLAMLPEADRLNGRAPAYTVDQLAPIALITADPTVLVVKADSPWRTLEEFIGLLKTHGATCVVDVRTVPRSRHNPQFNKDSLPDSLEKVGLSYVHLPGLGGLRHSKPDSLNGG